MAFLPLAGWASEPTYPVDLSDGWTIEFSTTTPTAVYTGNNVAPTITLKKGSDEIPASKFIATWSATPKDVGTYTVTVTANNSGTGTYGELGTKTKSFYVLKATIAVGNTPEKVADFTYDGEAHDLVQTAPTLTPTISGVKVQYSIDNKATWSTTAPKATNVGSYEVWYKVDGTDNYDGIDATSLGTVKVSGITIDAGNYTAPTLKTGLAFKWENGNKVNQELIEPGTVTAGVGTMMYRVGTSGAGSASIPTKADQGTYAIQWKIAGGTGYADVDWTNLGNVTIAAIKPTTVTPATGKTGLVYAGDADPSQALLAAAGSASEGASVKYQVRYKANAEDTYPTTWGSAIENKDDVKGANAGYYQVQTIVVAGGNYLANSDAEPVEIVIAKAPALTAAPTAADLTWNNDNQQLIAVGAGTVAGKVQYKLESGSWVTDITTIKGKDAKSYTVKYKVDDPNYVAVAETAIANVKIKKKVLSVKVNDITKTYDNSLDLTTATVDGGGAKFTFITPLATANDFSALTSYVALTDNKYKQSGEYADVITVDPTVLEGINTTKGYFYEYTIIPGKLTVAKAKLTVTAKTGLTTVFGTPKDISQEYTITGLVGSETKATAFSTIPVLTSNAAAVNPAADEYELSFTKGVLKANGNYEMSNAGEDEDGYVIGSAKFTVTADPNAKIVITVLPHTQTYTGVAESWDNIVEGTDYAVAGLISGDALTTAPTFTRSDATNFNVGTYELTASGAAVADMSKYPGGIIYNNSTFQITPAELTATVNQQTVVKASVAPELDQDAWSVEGLQNGETKADLGGTLAYVSATPAHYTTTGLKTGAIQLTITNTNYTLKTGTELGKLLVIDATDFVLDPTDANLAAKIEAADDGTSTFSIQFNDWAMNEKEWYAMVLPFATTPAELVSQLGTYVVVNKLKNSTIDAEGVVTVNFALEMDEIKAGEPFLIKPAAAKNWSVTATNKFTARKISKTITPKATDNASFTGTYETGNTVKWGYELDGTTENADLKYRWLAHKEYKGDNNWKNPKTNDHKLSALEAYLVLDAAATKAHIFVEDFDGNATAIKSLSADEINGVTTSNGWYTINGVKLQGAPPEKGIYINNGKKIVVK